MRSRRGCADRSSRARLAESKHQGHLGGYERVVVHGCWTAIESSGINVDDDAYDVWTVPIFPVLVSEEVTGQSLSAPEDQAGPPPCGRAFGHKCFWFRIELLLA